MLVLLMEQWLTLAVALLIGLVNPASGLVRYDSAPIQGPLDRPNGLCATFVLPHGLGYHCEEYVAQTPDGFLLGVQRMYNGAQGGSTAKKPVFLYHGILAGGDSWLLNPPPNSLPFMLGDAGYDVWIGNSRTTNFSSGHVTFTRTDEGFWNWSLDELAAYDLPTMLGVVFSKTSTTIHYIGYSQGSQSAFAAFSGGGGNLKLLDKVVLLAPAAYCNSVTPILTIGADLFIVDEMLLFGVYEFDPHLASGVELINRICGSPHANCTNDVTTAFIGPNCCINESRQEYYDDYGVSTSTKNIVHLAQQYRTQTFAKYDYGLLQNFNVYHSLFPPSYDLSAIPSMPLLLIHGGTDGLADVKDVSLLLSKLKFTPEVIFLPNYGHMDFMIGMTANIDVYSKVLAFLVA